MWLPKPNSADIVLRSDQLLVFWTGVRSSDTVNTKGFGNSAHSVPYQVPSPATPLQYATSLHWRIRILDLRDHIHYATLRSFCVCLYHHAHFDDSAYHFPTSKRPVRNPCPLCQKSWQKAQGHVWQRNRLLKYWDQQLSHLYPTPKW